MLSFLNSASDFQEFRLFIDEKYASLITYFPKLRERILYIPNEKFLGITSKKILGWSGIVATVHKFGDVFGFNELVSYKNLRIAGFRYKYLKRFIKLAKLKKKKKFTEYQLFKFIITEILGREIQIQGLSLSEDKELRLRASQYLEASGYKPGKTVIFVPYAISLGGLYDRNKAPGTFEELAVFFKSLGFEVLTNVDLVNTAPIPQTKPIFPPLELVRDVANLCGWVVGYRTGLLYLMASSSATLFACYPDKVFFTPYVEYYSLLEVSRHSKIYEFAGDLPEFAEYVRSTVQCMICS